MRNPDNKNAALRRAVLFLAGQATRFPDPALATLRIPDLRLSGAAAGHTVPKQPWESRQ
ncbi:MAG: hypothetical protein P8Z75_04845 [Gammaproteobacteria bacterium]